MQSHKKLSITCLEICGNDVYESQKKHSESAGQMQACNSSINPKSRATLAFGYFSSEK